MHYKLTICKEPVNDDTLAATSGYHAVAPKGGFSI